MSFHILPKDPRFFELFAADGDNLAAAAAALHVLSLIHISEPTRH